MFQLLPPKILGEPTRSDRVHDRILALLLLHVYHPAIAIADCADINDCGADGIPVRWSCAGRDMLDDVCDLPLVGGDMFKFQ